jgi:hypothetical protein
VDKEVSGHARPRLALDARKVLLGHNVQDRHLQPLNEQVADTLAAVLRDVINER